MVTLAVSSVFVWEQKNDSPDISEHKTRKKKVTHSKKTRKENNQRQNNKEKKHKKCREKMA